MTTLPLCTQSDLPPMRATTIIRLAAQAGMTIEVRADRGPGLNRRPRREFLNKEVAKISKRAIWVHTAALASFERYGQLILCPEQAYVFITGRREPELADSVKQIGKNVIGVQGDVAKPDDLDRLFGQIKREKGKLDIVFANPVLQLLPSWAR
jgi:short chain dehydrogenase